MGRPYVAEADLEDSGERYDSRMLAHFASGDVKVRLKRVIPSRSDVGEIQAHIAPNFGALTAFIRQHAWYGDDAEYHYLMTRKGRKITSGDVVFIKDERVKRLVEDGEWPTHHDALFNPAPPPRAPRAQPPPPPPPPPPQAPPPDPWAQMQQPGGFDEAPPRSDYGRRVMGDERFRERERGRFRDFRDEDEEEPPPRRRHDEPPPRPLEAPQPPPRSNDPVVSMLINEMSDMRTQMYDVLDRSAREQAATKAQFQALIDKLSAPVAPAVQPAPPAPSPPEGPRTLMDDPAISSLASMGAAMTALRTVSGTLGMVDGSVISEMQRKHEAQALKQQIERLNEKLNEVLQKPAVDAAAAAAAAAGAPAASPPTTDTTEDYDDDKEETAQEKLAKRTSQAGPAVIVENEDGEIDLVKSVMASVPGALALFGAMQEKKTKDAKEQYELLRKANIEAERQTKLINEYAASLERLNAAGGAMPEPPSDSSAEDSSSSEAQPVESDESVTSLADA